MKHAYLIIAHNQFKLLKELLYLLKDEDNDLFVHLDKKASIDEFFREIDKKQFPSLNVIQKHRVTWGGHSQLKCEISLIKAALEKNTEYDYLHIISGVDLPIKSKSYIKEFYEKNKGKEFLCFDKIQDKEQILARCNKYHWFQEKIGRKEHGFFNSMERYSLFIQKKMHISRAIKLESYLGKGPNWISITSDFAKYIINNEKIIKKYFWYSRCADEVFIHTLFNMSPFKGNLYVPSSDEVLYSNMIYTDWNRGKPYVFQDIDLPELVSSPYLFARKFSEDISIEKLKELLK